jgi:nucleoside-diphosphate-sugar epimerase
MGFPMRVLLTGGYGCIGSWIARALLYAGHRVWIYDLKEDVHRLRLLLDPEQIRQIGFLAGDVTDLPRLRECLEQQQISHLLHLAGLQVPVCRADPLLGARVNVLGTLAVFEAARLSQGQVKRVVYASSAAVFGPPERYPAGKLADDVPLWPTTHYGVFKCCNEGNARIYYQDHGITSVGLRPWTVYGVGRDFGMTSEPTRAIQAMALGRPYHISYGGSQDMQYVEDVAGTFVRCLEAPFEGARAYNVRGDVVDLPAFHRALAVADAEAARRITYGEKQLPIAFDLDDSQLQRDLGTMPRTPLAEGVRVTFEMFQRLYSDGRLIPDAPSDKR